MGTRPQDPVGRQPELARLEEALDELERGTTACLALEGEPGIGKTRLLEALRGRAEARRHLVLAGAAAEFERDLPFGVWVDALDAYVASQDLDPDVLGDLVGVLPSLRGDGAALGDERHRVQRALRALVELIAGDRPLVLVLDDLHWSDAASIDVLVALLRRPVGGRVLLALGYRSGKAPARLAAALAAPSVTILELGPLGEADCAALTGERLDATQRAAVYAQGGGNPFYTLQLAQVAHHPARSAPGDRLALDAGVPARRRGRAARGARRAQRRRPGAARAPERSPAIRSSPSSGTRSPSWSRRRAWRRWTSCSTRACSGPPTSPAASPSGTRSSAARSTSRPRAAGASRRTRAPTGRSPARVRRRRRARTTSSSPRPAATRPRSRCCSRPATPTLLGRRPAPPAGTRRRSG